MTDCRFDFRNQTFVIKAVAVLWFPLVLLWLNTRGFINAGMEIARVVVPERQRGKVWFKLPPLEFTPGWKGSKFRRVNWRMEVGSVED